MTKEEIKKILSKNKEILKKYKVKSIALFGSYVRNEQKKDSDIDFLVEFNESTFRNYIGLQSDLKRLYRRKVDLVCKDALKRQIKSYILKEIEWVKRA